MLPHETMKQLRGNEAPYGYLLLRIQAIVSFDPLINFSKPFNVKSIADGILLEHNLRTKNTNGE